MKKLLSIFISLVLLFGITTVGISVKAADYTEGDWTYFVYSDTVNIEKYTGKAENVVLPKTFMGKQVLSISDNVFKNNEYIKSLTIPEGYTEIGDYAFLNCTNLHTVIIPKTINEIGFSAFNGCTSLKNLTLTEGGTTVSGLDYYAFAGCTELEKVIIPANYKTISYGAFSDCTKLKTVIIRENKDLNLSRSIDKIAFRGCTAIEELIIPEGFTYIGESAFGGCTSLHTLTIPKTINEVGFSAFNGCTSLKNLTLTKGGTTVSGLGTYAFAGCTSLEKVIIPANYKTISYGAFSDCTKLKTVIIRENIDLNLSRSIGHIAFGSCDNLTTIHIPADFTDFSSDSFAYSTPKLVICSTADECAAKTFAKENSITFKVCDGNHQLPPKTHTVVYYANGGEVTPEKTVVEEGKSVTLPIPVKKVNITYNSNGGTNATAVQSFQLNFGGWATSSGATIGEFAGGASYKPTKDITLYAVWQKTTVDISSSIPKRSGYTFLGWSRDSSATAASYKAGGKINLSGNVTLYAVWEEISAPEKLSVNVDDFVLNYKDTISLPVKVTGTNDYIVEIVSSNESVATVDKEGNITAVGTGEAEITVTVTDEYGNVVEDTCTVTVNMAWWQWIIYIVFFGWIWY